MLNDDSPSLKMGNSHWPISSNGSSSSSLCSFFIGPIASVDAGTSLLEFTNTMPTYITYTDVKFHNVLFSNPEGTASLLSDYEAAGDKIPKVSTFNRIEMRNSGIILGENVIDSLIFTAGKSYDLDAAHAQTINEYFQLVGNPCDSIELRSTFLGRKAVVMMNGGVVRADFIQMRDQSGIGSTQFLAGGNSSNVTVLNLPVAVNLVYDADENLISDGLHGYTYMASRFFQESQAAKLPTKIDSQGVIRVFDPKTGSFGSFNPNGTTRTFYKPSSPTYFDRQPGTLVP